MVFFPLDFSDHCPIGCIRSTKISRAHPHVTIRRSYKHFHEQAFLTDLFYIDIGLTSAMPDPDLALFFFISTFNDVANKHAPKKKIRMKNRINPWFSSEISNLIREKAAAWKKAQISNLIEDWVIFCQKGNR